MVPRLVKAKCYNESSFYFVGNPRGRRPCWLSHLYAVSRIQTVANYWSFNTSTARKRIEFGGFCKVSQDIKYIFFK